VFLQVTSLAGNIRDLIHRTRALASLRSGREGNYLSHLPYPVAVVQQVAAVMGR
jgi:hypothetical protein